MNGGVRERREARRCRVENTYIRHSVAGRSKSSDCPKVADQASVQKLAAGDIVLATFQSTPAIRITNTRLDADENITRAPRRKIIKILLSNETLT